MTYVFINKENPNRIKMIDADNMVEAKEKLIERLELAGSKECSSGYEFGYFL